MLRQLAVAAILMISGESKASLFNFSFSDTQNLFGSETVSGTGLLTANMTGNGIFNVTALTGTLTINESNSYALSLNAPGTVVVNSINNNRLQFPAPTGTFEPTFFDEDGFGFSANGVNYDLYGIGEGFSGYELSADNHIPFGSAAVSVTAAVPEPATWAMMLLGFSGIGALAYRRRSALVKRRFHGLTVLRPSAVA